MKDNSALSPAAQGVAVKNFFQQDPLSPFPPDLLFWASRHHVMTLELVL